MHEWAKKRRVLTGSPPACLPGIRNGAASGLHVATRAARSAVDTIEPTRVCWSGPRLATPGAPRSRESTSDSSRSGSGKNLTGMKVNAEKRRQVFVGLSQAACYESGQT